MFNNYHHSSDSDSDDLDFGSAQLNFIMHMLNQL